MPQLSWNVVALNEFKALLVNTTTVCVFVHARTQPRRQQSAAHHRYTQNSWSS